MVKDRSSYFFVFPILTFLENTTFCVPLNALLRFHVEISEISQERQPRVPKGTLAITSIDNNHVCARKPTYLFYDFLSEWLIAVSLSISKKLFTNTYKRGKHCPEELHSTNNCSEHCYKCQQSIWRPYCEQNDM